MIKEDILKLVKEDQNRDYLQGVKERAEAFSFAYQAAKMIPGEIQTGKRRIEEGFLKIVLPIEKLCSFHRLGTFKVLQDKSTHLTGNFIIIQSTRGWYLLMRL